MSNEPQYSYMEFVTAGSRSRWHVRKLTDKGQKFGGGIDTTPLCGRTYPNGDRINGWDLRVELDRRHDDHTCQSCLEELNRVRRGEVIYVTVKV